MFHRAATYWPTSERSLDGYCVVIDGGGTWGTGVTNEGSQGSQGGRHVFHCTPLYPKWGAGRVASRGNGPFTLRDGPQIAGWLCSCDTYFEVT